MSAELDAKWCELVAAGRAEWSSGMLIRNADGPVRIAGVLRRCRYTNDLYVAEVRCGPMPGWSDPATLGALLGQVRTRYMDPTIYARRVGNGWTLYDALGVLDLRGRPRSGPDEVSALLRGLELAP